VTVSAHDPGTRSTDDWDGFGQLLTGSGTSTFDRVAVDPRDVVELQGGAVGWYRAGALQQLILIGIVAGMAQRAVEDTVEYVRARRRTVGFAGEHLPREDPLVQSVVGQLSSAAHVTRALVLSSARALEASACAGDDAAREVLLKVFKLQQAVFPLVLDALSRSFEVGGASAVSRTYSLDRHWRNVRTIASHNPAAQRAAALGQWELNATLPDWELPAAQVESALAATHGEREGEHK
jgi:alkylation response protein AidB-like acyl-CoA dehydrogenase